MSTTKTARSLNPANGLNQEFTDEYGNQRMAVTAAWIQKAEQVDNEFARNMVVLAKRLGYLSVKQFEAVNRMVR